MKPSILLALVLILMGAISAQAQSSNKIIEAKIDLVSNGEFLEVSGMALNKSDVSKSLSYKILINRTDPETGNTSKNEQKGNFVLDQGERKVLSKGTINASDKSKVIILLLIYDKNKVIVGKDRIALNSTPEDELKAKKALLGKAELNAKEISKDYGDTSEDGVATLKGIVIENTKTKPGRDFYRLFADKYRFKKINGERVILIEEVLALGSNTKILIKADNDLIFQFFVNPRTNYIEQMVDYAVKRTDIYFQKLKKGRNQIRRY